MVEELLQIKIGTFAHETSESSDESGQKPSLDRTFRCLYTQNMEANKEHRA